MHDQRVYLKVKVKSLAEEARIIRREERKNPFWREGLAEHRRTVVRSEARHTLLAYGFIRGRKYEQLERNAQIPPDWEKVKRMVERYGAPWEEGDDYRARQRRKEELLLRFEKWKPGGGSRSQRAKHWVMSKVS